MTLPNIPFELPVVGVTFCDQYPKVAYRLKRRLESVQMGLAYAPVIRLEQEPDNPHDPNAVSVWWDKTQLGYLARNMAKRFAKELDAGTEWAAEVARIEVHPDSPDNPSIWIRLWRTGVFAG